MQWFPIVEQLNSYTGNIRYNKTLIYILIIMYKPMLFRTMGGAVLGCFAFVNLAQQTKDNKEKGDYMFLHKSCGTLAAMLLVPRLADKVISKSPGPMSQGIERYAALASHTTMYGFLIALPVTGVGMGYFGGKGLPFFFTTLPGADDKNKDGKLAGSMFKWHKYLGRFVVHYFSFNRNAY